MAAPVRPFNSCTHCCLTHRILNSSPVRSSSPRGSATQLAVFSTDAPVSLPRPSGCTLHRQRRMQTVTAIRVGEGLVSTLTSGDPASPVDQHSAEEQHGWLRPEAARRKLLQLLLLSAGTAGLFRPASAYAGLLQLPATELNNEYYLIRAGESEAESQDYTLTNTVYKTNMSSGLSKQGKRQVVRQTAAVLKDMEACASGCWLWPSITQRCYQTAEILSALLDIGRSRIVPEYSFLDPRGVGAMEGLPLAQVAQQLQEGDTVSSEWRPPHGTDGTPNESVIDVLVRLRQVMSICETQYRGTSVLIIAPDSDNLSIIQAAMLGTDLRSHNQYAFKPGEVRVLQLAEARDADFFAPRNFSCPNPPLCR